MMRTVPPLPLVLPLVLALVLIGCSGPESPVGERLTATENGADSAAGHADRLPDLELDRLVGGAGTVALPELAGSAESGAVPVVINVWAQWCPPCRDELPHFQTLYEQAGDRVRVVGIDYLDQEAPAREFIQRLGLEYEQLSDPDGTLRAPFRLGVGLPATVFVRPGGRIVHVAHKPYESAADLMADVEHYLGVAL